MTDKKDAYARRTILDFLEDLSGRSIVPGGGSAAALSAAIGTALNLMVINYTFQEKESVADNDILILSKTRQEESLRKLSFLIDKDCKVFSELMRALSAKEDAQDKYIAAAKVPMKVCHECHESMGITAVLSRSGNKNLVTDVGCAASLLKAAFDSAKLNVEVNLKMIEDKAFVEDAAKGLAKLEEAIVKAEEEIRRNVEEVMRGGKD